MDDLAAVGRYFERKQVDWKSTDGSVAAHVRRVGKKGLVAEFRTDGEFDTIGRYLHRVSDVQYVHDTGYAEFKTKVRDSLFGPSGNASEVERQVNVIVPAALLACGITPFGERLVRIAGALPRPASRDPPQG